MKRLFEAEDEGEISREEREQLAKDYENEMMEIEEELNKAELIVSLNELEAIRTNIIKQFETTLSDTQQKHAKKGARKARKILVLSGSCASVTGKQIEWASTHGFACIRIDPAKLFTPASQKEESARVFEKSISKLNEGKSVIIYSAMGPEDTNISKTQKFRVWTSKISRRDYLQRIENVHADMLNALTDSEILTKHIHHNTKTNISVRASVKSLF